MPERSLSFHRSLYRPEAVRSAALAYDSVATIEVLERDNETLAVLSEVDPDLEADAADAFANHVLFETIRIERAASGDGSHDAARNLG